MNNKLLRRRFLRVALGLLAMLLLIMIGYPPGMRSPLALSASEPMVSLPGGMPPQASELLAAATPGAGQLAASTENLLDIQNKQAARQIADDLQNP